MCIGVEGKESVCERQVRIKRVTEAASHEYTVGKLKEATVCVCVCVKIKE